MIPFGSHISQKDLYAMITSVIDGPFDPVQVLNDLCHCFIRKK